MNQLLEEKGWSIARLSRETGIPTDSLHKWKKGGTDNPRGNALEVLAERFGVTIEWFRYGTGQKYHSEKKSPQMGGGIIDKDYVSVPIITPQDLVEYTFDNTKYEEFILREDNFSLPAKESLSDKLSCLQINNSYNEPFLTRGDLVTLDLIAESEFGKLAVAVINGFEEPVVGTLTLRIVDGKQVKFLSIQSEAIEDINLESVSLAHLYKIVAIIKFP